MSLKKISSALSFAFVILTNTANADIKETATLSEVVGLFQNTTPDMLALFDVDDVLIMPEDAYRFTHPFRTKWAKKTKKELSKERREYLISLSDPHLLQQFFIMVNPCERGMTFEPILAYL